MNCVFSKYDKLISFYLITSLFVIHAKNSFLNCECGYYKNDFDVIKNWNVPKDIFCTWPTILDTSVFRNKKLATKKRFRKGSSPLKTNQNQ